ncbi:MAG: hypothetical protein A3F74_12980 [Betaproteobacteria bacterium RIFCSPLOWO2_12_FULL_62_58]|nr:MAG: hypothetical protein A3F74_12980 [Betaproteobacteria bacterium RIFCSPLOWO2_12_FULL_62_58]
MRLRKRIAAFATLCVFSGTAAAVGGIADVTLYDRAQERALPVYRHEGRYYVVGKPGNEYQIRVRNRTGAEILAVVSVEKSTSLGTGHRRSEASHVTYTRFERATVAPEEVIVIHYDTYRNLVAQGVIRAPRVAMPTPFPGRFVPDPR